MSAVVQHPRLVEIVEQRKLRKKFEKLVGRLIAVLDEIDADPEAEPSLGAPEASVITPQWPRAGSTDDREAVDEDGGDALDQGEETLGWPANLRQVALGNNTADGEPSLASPENHNDQRRWAAGARDDREEEHEHGDLAEYGVADQDGLAEQCGGVE